MDLLWNYTLKYASKVLDLSVQLHGKFSFLLHLFINLEAFSTLTAEKRCCFWNELARTVCFPSISHEKLTLECVDLKGGLHDSAHVHESKCCFSPVHAVVSSKASSFNCMVSEPIRS